MRHRGLNSKARDHIRVAEEEAERAGASASAEISSGGHVRIIFTRNGVSRFMFTGASPRCDASDQVRKAARQRLAELGA